METNSIQKELLLTSYLFEYPSKEWWGDVKECAAEAHTVARPQSREVLEEFFDYVEESDPKEYEDAYVRAFDFSQNTNLYLTTHNRTDFGKQSEELLAYKPHILGAVRPKLELLRDRLIEAKLPYAFLLDVVLTGAAHLEGRTAS